MNSLRLVEASIFALVCAGLLAGCELAEDHDEVGPRPAPVSVEYSRPVLETFLSVNRSSFSEHMAKLDPDESKDFAREVNVKLMQLYALTAEAESWSTADRDVRRMLSLEAEHPAISYFEQFAAKGMLETRLLPEANELQTAKAIAYYTDLLLKHRSLEAEVIAPALERLSGVWSKGRITEAAQQTLAALESQSVVSHLESEPRFDELSVSLRERLAEREGRSAAGKYRLEVLAQ